MLGLGLWVTPPNATTLRGTHSAPHGAFGSTRRCTPLGQVNTSVVQRSGRYTAPNPNRPPRRPSPPSPPGRLGGDNIGKTGEGPQQAVRASDPRDSARQRLRNGNGETCAPVGPQEALASATQDVGGELVYCLVACLTHVGPSPTEVDAPISLG